VLYYINRMSNSHLQNLLNTIAENPSKHVCLPSFTRTIQVNPRNTLWGGELRTLTPAKLMTAFNYVNDPLMILAGQAYVSTQVRDTSFQLQEKAVNTIRGNRKLTKASMAEALSAMNPTVEQTKKVALILHQLYEVQTVCFDVDAKKVWTVPEDLRKWSTSPTLWIDARCEHMIDWSASTASKEVNLGEWLSDREDDGWAIEWPVAEGGFEEIKQKVIERNVLPRVAKPKKDDWAKTLGRCEAIEHFLRLE
jgi:hypothetical protein